MASLLLGGTAQAALQDRDLDRDTVVDTFYDTDLDITWLRDADVNGQMNWDTAVSWADGFSFGGYSDWRLPASDTCEGYNCTGNEMGHLWYVELGNLAGGPMTNTGDFQNLQAADYFSGTTVPYWPSTAYGFSTTVGQQAPAFKTNEPDHAMAVRPGDVAVVPEPETYALMLSGVAALAFARRRMCEL